jgi:hypothetical protein
MKVENQEGQGPHLAVVPLMMMMIIIFAYTFGSKASWWLKCGPWLKSG